MNQSRQILAVQQECEEAIAQVIGCLSRSGFRVMRSFDLRSARTASGDFPCPRHGALPCDCQLAVLLIYGTAPQPATLLAQGHDGQTWLSLVISPEQRPDPRLGEAIVQALASERFRSVDPSPGLPAPDSSPAMRGIDAA